MGIHVAEQIRIERPRAEVAAWAADPDNAPRWRKDVAKVEWKSHPPLRTGSRIALTTPSLGLPLAYRYTVEDHVPGERTVLRTEEGPFPIETTLAFADAEDGAATDVTLTTDRREARFEGRRPHPRAHDATHAAQGPQAAQAASRGRRSGLTRSAGAPRRDRLGDELEVRDELVAHGEA